MAVRADARISGPTGKGLEAALCLAAGQVFGGKPDDLLGIAVAIELLHNAFLVHDDIADGSELRRGRPTLAAKHGMAAALNAGDGLAIVAGQVLRKATRRLDRDLADLVWTEFDTMAMRTLEGQATEVGWQLDNVEHLRPEDYLELIMHKTCWYTTIHPLRVGAMVGSGGTVDLGPLVRFGFHFGAAFQIRDDLLNLVGDEQTYGKEILGDLYEGKRTLTLVHLMATADGADRVLVSDYLRRSRAERSDELVRTVRGLMDDYGSIDFTREYAEGILLVAEEYFEQAFTAARPGPDLDFLRSLVPTSGRAGAENRAAKFVLRALGICAGPSAAGTAGTVARAGRSRHLRAPPDNLLLGATARRQFRRRGNMCPRSS